MKPSLFHWLFGLLSIAALQMTSCGSGNSTVAGGGGISGTGAQTVAVGQVTGFGSVWVGGTEYFPRPASKIFLRFDNFSSQQETSLKLGMSISVHGQFNPTFNRFEYESIDYRPELRGRLDSVSLANNTLIILGRLVRVDDKTLYDGGIANIAALDSIKGQQPEVEVSGNITGTGEIIATRVAVRNNSFTLNDPVQLKGTITAVSPSAASVGAQTIGISTATAFINMLRSDLQAGMFIEIKGVFDGTTITATRIERKLPVNGAITGEELEFRGVAQSGISNNSVMVAGPDGPVTVTVTDSTRYRNKGTVVSSNIVVSGIIVEVKGIMQANGSLAATDIKAEQ